MQTSSLPAQLSRVDWRLGISLLLPAIALAIFVAGLITQNTGLIGGGAVALCAVWKNSRRDGHSRYSSVSPVGQSSANHPTLRAAHKPAPKNSEHASADPTPVTSPTEHLAKRVGPVSREANDLLREMIDTGRYALLLRPEKISQLTENEIAEVLQAMDDQMCVVPEGRVLLGEYAERATWSANPASTESAGLEWVDGCYLDRYAVTNQQFQNFVDAGGYEEFQLWPEEALPALFEFVDKSGVSAPAFWTNGRHEPNEATLPVVGISWYEAMAYAHWVGKRLPTDAEWTKAGAWPVETSPGRISQRRYPWGDTFEPRRANLWAAGVQELVPVDAYEDGASLGNLNQLIGNVWEWSDSMLSSSSREDQSDSDGLKVIHGGAFNTYFENQATCHFRSGELPLGRRSNIGLRLALSFDAIADPDASADTVPVDSETE